MRNRLLALALLVVLMGGLVTVSYHLGAESGGAPDRAAGQPTGLPPDFSALADLYERITSEAVDPPTHEELLEGAIQGMLERLEDPYAVYYDAAEFTSFSELLDGKFSGVGVMVEETPEGVTIVNVIAGAPAEAAGLEVGERIVAVDGEDLRAAPLRAVVQRVQGEEGTTVLLGLEGGSQGPREVAVIRAQIDRPVLEVERLDDGVAHVRLLQFTEGVGARVREAVERHRAEGGRGVVLDLRGNPGGLLREAVAVASVFIEGGTIVSVQERGRDRQTFEATGGALTDVPLVVLVDASSASASEIVAGAVQDLGRGPVVGTPTFGKGTVQTVRPLRDGSGVKFTTAEYFTSSGDSIEGTGIAPDRVVAEVENQLAAAQEALRAELVGAARS
ncbi:MAG TPA: S41 family peptidase [Egibacteraceae bacterium]|jgi:carboxyl-terminal processing protease|nr:S41 family peptidase [Egibacteraceae bacterium]